MEEDRAPIWQPQHAGYSKVPLVPYVSFEEYTCLLKQLREEYYGTVEECVEGALKNNNLMMPRSISHCGLLGVWRELKQKGRDSFLKLTKGYGYEWCVALNAFLMTAMDSSARTFFFFHLHPMMEDVGLEEYKEELITVLRREVKLFFSDWDLQPTGYYPFVRKNFKCHGSSEDKEYTDIPIALYQQIMLAFAMGTHPRLGGDAGCLVNSLTSDLVVYLFAWDSPL